MASASQNKRTERVERVIVEEVEVNDGYVLMLTNDEAHFLRDILGRIGGHPSKSRRRFADTIADALDRADAPHTNYYELANQTESTRRSIYFKDGS
jgi:hypothetical protein